jgi:hypothetical protein
MPKEISQTEKDKLLSGFIYVRHLKFIETESRLAGTREKRS